jgi:hypothetical protein
MLEGAVIRSNGLALLSARWQGFVSWWFTEFWEAIPSKWQTWIRGEAAPVLLIRRDRDFVICDTVATVSPIGAEPANAVGHLNLTALFRDPTAESRSFI